MSESPFPDLPNDSLHIKSWFADGHHPAIFWQLNSQWAIISLVEARARAQALFQAIGYAEGEAAIANGVFKLHIDALSPSGRGFGDRADFQKQAAAVKSMRIMATLREIFQQERSPLLEGVDVVFGAKKRRALINVFWYGEPIQWEIVQALEHAIGLIEAAEAAESDAFFRWWLTESVGIEPEQAYAMIHEFQTFRDRRQLEDLFKEGERC